jgi:inorganic pyrophosphatase
MIHLMHDVPVGKDSPDIFNVIVEIPKSCKNKYEVDEDLGIMRVDRVLHGVTTYPHNYGFIPRTHALDDDPLDVFLLSQIMIHPGCVTYAKALGVMQMTDNGKIDSKIIAVQIGDPVYNHYNDIVDLPPYLLKEIRAFFEQYNSLDSNKEVLVEEFLPAEEAKKIILACTRRYKEEIEPKRKKVTKQN